MRYLAIGLIVLLAAGVWGYQKYVKGSSTASPPGAAAPAAGAKGPGPGGPGGGMPVEAEVVKAERFAQEIIAIGSLTSAESVTLSFEIAGRLSGIHFREGQPVDKGALLFALDDSIYRAELQQASAALALSKRNNDRAQELFGRGLVS